jgi:hypothetical protein
MRFESFGLEPMSATIFQNSEPGSNRCPRWVIEQRHMSVKATLMDRRRPQALTFDVLEIPGAIIKVSRTILCLDVCQRIWWTKCIMQSDNRTGRRHIGPEYGVSILCITFTAPDPRHLEQHNRYPRRSHCSALHGGARQQNSP